VKARAAVIRGVIRAVVRAVILRPDAAVLLHAVIAEGSSFVLAVRVAPPNSARDRHRELESRSFGYYRMQQNRCNAPQDDSADDSADDGADDGADDSQDDRRG
jgi:hypothetical protein